MITLLNYASAIVLIAVLVTIHEFGHFVVARACGVHVRIFSIGFGPRLLGFQYQGTDYRISAVPLGGYVRMAGADPFGDAGTDEPPDEDPHARGEVSDAQRFMTRPAYQRLLISLAGPAFNLILPVAVFTALYWVGEPQSRADIESLAPNSIAAGAGVALEDQITRVNGNAVNTWIDVIDVLQDVPHQPVSLELNRSGQTLTVTLPVATLDPLEPLAPSDFGIGSLAPSTRVLADDPNSPAARAGIPSNANLMEVAGVSVQNWNEVRRVVLAQPADQPIEIAWIDVDPLTQDDGTIALPDNVPLHRTRILPVEDWTPELTPADDTLYQRTGLASASLGVKKVSEDSAAMRAGIKEGDRFLSISDQPILTWGDVVRIIMTSSEGKGAEQVASTLPILIRREGAVVRIDVLPDVVHTTDVLGQYQWRPQIGVMGGGDNVLPPRVARPYPLLESAERGYKETLGIAGMMVELIGKMVIGEVSPQKSLGGPLEIVRQSAAAAERGLFDWARHMAVFSISLGVLNMLPVPILDGGQALMYLAEWLRGRPLPLRLRELALQIGVVFMAVVFILVMGFDFHRWITG